ncbi:MAG: sugar ABC transporter substrate-binding protein [Treponemataceae bacterium]
MKRGMIIISAVCATLMIVGCEKAPAPKAAAPAPAAAAQQAPAEVSKSKLPVNGIGASISSQVKAKTPYTIACIVKNSTNPYMVKLLAGVTKAGADMGFKAVVMAPAINDSVEEQVKIMEDMIQKGAKGFVLVPVDTNGIMPGVRKAMTANIPVATIGTPAAVDTFLRTGVDYTETGRLVAKAVADKIGGKGDVVILEGPPGAQNARERLAGINEVLGKYPGIKIVASQTANFKRTEGMQVTENLIQKFKSVAAIIGMNDESALGAIQALKAAGMKNVVIGGFDGNQDGAAAIKNGEMYVSYNTDPFGSAYLAAAYIVQSLNDGTKPPQYFVPFPSESDKPLITGENVDTYISSIAWWK